MKKLKVYLDTSVINFLFADDAPEFKSITIDFFELHIDKYDVFISDIVVFEINKTTALKHRERLLNVVDQYPIRILSLNDQEEIERIANLYINEGVIPPSKFEDALHLAISSVYEMDILLSWNFKHLANIKKQQLVNSINEREGYTKKLNLLSPLEVEYDE